MKRRLVFNPHKSDRINKRNNASPEQVKERTVIYALVDPRDNLVFYIGLTNNLYSRFKQHMLMTGENTRKQERIQAILDDYRLPWMHTLEVVEEGTPPRFREVVWIQRYLDAGYDLLNDEVQEGKLVELPEVALVAQEGA